MKTCSEHPDKNRYNTNKDAETAIILSGNKNLKTYYCDFCKGWHLASIIKNV